MDVIKKLYVAIRKWLQPYYQPSKTWEVKQKSPKKVNKSKAVKPKVKPKVEGKANKPNKKNPLNFRIMNQTQPIGADISKLKQLPPPQTAWYWSDNQSLELLSHLLPNTAFIYKKRNQNQRKKLKPTIYPQLGKPFDRTHLIPFGYHGIENDPRIVIGWSPEDNQGPMADFENKQKRRKTPIYWLARVTKTRKGLKLTYTVCDVKTLKVLDKKSWELNTPYKWLIK